MENVETKHIAVIEFNDAQKAAMAAALMAVADEIVEPTNKVKTEKTKKPPLRVGDIIELTDSEDDAGDSDNSSDCEITGFVTLDTNEPVAENVKFNPPVVKVEIKEELVQLPTAQVLQQVAEDTQDRSVIFNDGEKQEEQSEQLQAADVSVPQPLQIWQKEEHPLDMGEDIIVEPFVAESHDMPVITSVLTLMQPASSSYGDTLLEPLDHQNTYAAATHLTLPHEGNVAAEDEESKSSTSVASSGELFMPENGNLAAATFRIDQFADEDPENLNADDDESRDNAMDDNIIELNDSDDDNDEHMDEDTEKKLIDLIESDMDEETNTSSVEPPEKTFADLIHYFCPQCGLPCGSLRKWRGHLEAEHAFSDISKLNMRTIINKDGDLCHQCKTCHSKFRRNAYFSTLLNHCLKHLPFSDYMKCRLCDKNCSTRNQMRTHQLREHNKICRHYVGQTARNTARQMALFCPVCGQKQKTRERWKGHLEDEHDYTASLEEKVKRCEITGQWECLTCARKLHDRLQSHMFQHEPYKPFRCKLPDCTFSCTTVGVFSSHMRRKHLNGKLVRLCMYCDEKFDTSYERTQHVSAKHPRRLQKCHVCEKIFGTPAKLLAHMNTSNHQKLK